MHNNLGLFHETDPLSAIQFAGDEEVAAAYAHFNVRAKRGQKGRWAKAGLPLPIIGGGDFVKHPLLAPTIVGNQIRVDAFLNQPTRITRYLADITLQRFLLERFFTNSGGVSGGSVIYDTVNANDLYLTRDVERVVAGTEFPIITSDRVAPSVAEVEKWGAKTYITDEARDRNSTIPFTREMRKLGNTMVRKLNQRAMAILDLAITANGGNSEMTGHDWSAVVVGGSSQSAAGVWPHADFAAAQLSAEQDELGVVFDLWVMNPVNAAELALVYGAGLAEVLRSAQISIYTSNRVAVGTAYAIASGQVGQFRLEQPMLTENWRDPHGRQMTWSQTSVRPVMFVDNAWAVLKVTGL